MFECHCPFAQHAKEVDANITEFYSVWRVTFPNLTITAASTPFAAVPRGDQAVQRIELLGTDHVMTHFLRHMHQQL